MEIKSLSTRLSIIQLFLDFICVDFDLMQWGPMPCMDIKGSGEVLGNLCIGGKLLSLYGSWVVGCGGVGENLASVV
jgi:hypothetical protein